MPAPAEVRLRAAAVAVALGLMTLVPITALDARPSHFGWHMYAVNVAPLAIEVTTTAGVVEKRDIFALAAKVRAEPDYTEPAAEFICRTETNVRFVRFSRDYPALRQEYACDKF